MSEHNTKKRLREDTKVFLIGHTQHQIVGAKLPSNRQVLSVFFHNMREFNISAKESARIVANEVFIFWDKARIDRSAEWYCIKKIDKLYEQLRNLQKSASNPTPNYTEDLEKFTSSLDDLFDIAARDALKTMKNEDSKAFLIAQRKKGREGSLLGIDKKGQEQEEKRQKRLDDELKRKEAAERDRQLYEPGKNILNLIPF